MPGSAECSLKSLGKATKNAYTKYNNSDLCMDGNAIEIELHSLERRAVKPISGYIGHVSMNSK